jgi:polyisoprenoid-binding protein YceI
MRRCPIGLVLLVAAITSTVACHKGDGSAGGDAGKGPAAAKMVRNAAAGEQLVDVEKSKLVFAMVKDRDVANPVKANVMLRDGALSLAAGTARMTIDLTTFDSQIPVRNERVRNFFFEVSATGWDTAELTIQKLPDAALASLRDHKPVMHTVVEGDLKLHGKTARVSMTLDAGYGSAGELWVRSTTPVEVKVSDFGLTDNLKRLSSICMHDSIDDIVKIDVAVQFPAK